MELLQSTHTNYGDRALTTYMAVKHELSSCKFYKLLFYVLVGEYQVNRRISRHQDYSSISNLADAAGNHTLRRTSASQLCPIKARGLIDRLTATLPLRLFHITCRTRLLAYAVKPLASAGMQSWLVAAATSSHGLNSMLPTQPFHRTALQHSLPSNFRWPRKSCILVSNHSIRLN